VEVEEVVEVVQVQELQPEWAVVEVGVELLQINYLVLLI
jgi:hypothetical protein